MLRAHDRAHDLFVVHAHTCIDPIHLRSSQSMGESMQSGGESMCCDDGFDEELSYLANQAELDGTHDTT